MSRYLTRKEWAERIGSASRHAVRVRAVPICDRCDKPVDELTEEVDDFLRRVTFTAACHGERERVTLTLEELARLPDSRLDFGRAFVKPRQLKA